MAARKPVSDLQKEQLLVFWFCSVRSDLLSQLVRRTRYARSKWKRLGISAAALESVRELISGNEEAFVAVAEAWRLPCHPPPCPDDAFLGEVARMVKALACGPRK